jgi:hypothetical protein
MNSNLYSATLTPPTALNHTDLFGVYLLTSGSTTSTSVSNFQLTGNWRMTLTYRMNDGTTEEPGKKLQLCTELSNTQTSCVIDANATGKTVYMLGGTDNTGAAIGTFTQDAVERKGGVAFDVNSCGGSTDIFHSRCNHIHSIKVEEAAANGSTTTTVYHCVDGACDLGIKP